MVGWSDPSSKRRLLMIYVHSMARAVRNYPERPALSVGDVSLNFRELHNRVKSMAPELVRRTRELLPKVKLVQVYGLSETGYLTGLLDQEHEGKRLTSCGRPCPGVELQVADEAGKEVE